MDFLKIEQTNSMNELMILAQQNNAKHMCRVHICGIYCRISSLSLMLCEKHGPRTKAEVFVVTEARGPCFPHGMGDHDQILL